MPSPLTSPTAMDDGPSVLMSSGVNTVGAWMNVPLVVGKTVPRRTLKLAIVSLSVLLMWVLAVTMYGL